MYSLRYSESQAEPRFKGCVQAGDGIGHGRSSVREDQTVVSIRSSSPVGKPFPFHSAEWVDHVNRTGGKVVGLDGGHWVSRIRNVVH